VKSGVPPVVIDAGHMDPRIFSIAQFEPRAGAIRRMPVEKKCRTG
jgi:hypothetical protein